eukprot:scaffold4719_cov314-Pinguiococcus_pyrenoidosus.AAC.3
MSKSPPCLATKRAVSASDRKSSARPGEGIVVILLGENEMSSDFLIVDFPPSATTRTSNARHS